RHFCPKVRFLRLKGGTSGGGGGTSDLGLSGSEGEIWGSDGGHCASRLKNSVCLAERSDLWLEDWVVSPDFRHPCSYIPDQLSIIPNPCSAISLQIPKNKACSLLFRQLHPSHIWG